MNLLGAIKEVFTDPSKAWDRFKNGETNIKNEEIANQNLDFQKENFEYQKAIQEEMFQREDTAYERTVADMRNAGLNPLSMQGANSAGEVIPTTPLHNDFQMQGTGAIEVFQGLAGLMGQAQGLGMGNLMAQGQKAKNLAQDIQNIKDMATTANYINTSNLDYQMKEFLKNDLQRQNDYNEFFNLNPQMTDKERQSKIMMYTGGPMNDINANFARQLANNLTSVMGLSGGTIQGWANTMSGAVDSAVKSGQKALENGKKKVENGFNDLKKWFWGE